MPSGTFRRVAIAVLAWAAGALVLGVRANYITLIRRQGVGAPVAWYRDGLAISALVLLFAPLWARARRLLLIVSGLALTGFALLSGFTIGYQLVPSVVLTGVALALVRSPSPPTT